VNPFFSNDPTWLGQATQYHIIPGTVDLSAVANSPNVSSYPTTLNDPSLVHLLAGQSQYIGLTKVGGEAQIANQNSLNRIVKSATYENLQIYIISAVVDLPASLPSVLTIANLGLSQNLTTLTTYLPQSLLSTLSTSPSVTLFAPIDQAFTDALASGHISPSMNASTVQNLLLNHVINGTTVYTGSAQKDYTSAGGETITVGTGGLDDGSGSVVYYRGEQVANIVRGDIPIQNGVLHLIDAVLPNPASNPTAALSAFSAATATATASPLRRRIPSRFFGGRNY